MPNAKDPMWYILEGIRSDIQQIEQKQDQSLVTVTTLSTNMLALTDKVAALNKTLMQDNGKPSVLTQLQDLNSGVRDLRKDVGLLKKNLGVKEPKEVAVERLKTTGKVAGYIAAVVPGMIAFLDRFF